MEARSAARCRTTVPLPAARPPRFALPPGLQSAANEIPSVARTIFNLFTGPCQRIYKLAASGKREQRYKDFVVLDGLSGVVRPGTLTLVLSPPGHGK